MWKCVRRVTIPAMLLVATWAQAVTVTFTTSPLGGTKWRYEYVVTNDSLAGGIEEFTLYFAPSLYAGLAAGQTPGWDILVAQPDAQIPDDGFVDGLAIGPGGIAAGAAASGFSATFSFLGTGTPGPQPFEVVDPTSFAPLAAGMTVMGPDTARKIAALYIAFFSRAADFDGLKFWRTVAQNSGLNDLLLMRLMAGGFANHPSFTAIYGALDDAAYVDAIYVNVGGRTADAAGKAYWLGLLAGGQVSRADFVADFVYGLLEITEQTLQDLVDSGAITEAERQSALSRKNRMGNRSVVALAFVNALGTASNLLPGTDPLNPASLAADPSYRASQNIVRNVSEAPATMTSPMTYLGAAPTIAGINATFGP